MDKAHRVIENPLSYLRPTWRGALVFALLFAIIAATGIAIVKTRKDNRPAPQQPANR